MTDQPDNRTRKLRLQFQTLHIDRPDEDLQKAYRAIIVKDGRKTMAASAKGDQSDHDQDCGRSTPKSSGDEKRA